MVREFAYSIVAVAHVFVGAVRLGAICYGLFVAWPRPGVFREYLRLRVVRFGRRPRCAVGMIWALAVPVLNGFGVPAARRPGSSLWAAGLAVISPAGLGVVSGTAASTVV